MRQDRALQLDDPALCRQFGIGRIEQQRRRLLDLPGSLAHLAVETLALRLVGVVQLAGADLATFPEPTEQDLRLVRRLAFAPAAGLAPLLALLLFAHGQGLPLALQTTLVQAALGGLARLLPALRVEGIAAAIAAQAEGRQLDDPLHALEQFAVMADQQQAAVPGRQPRPQQGARRPVERVARFVEDEEVGVVEECAEQRYAHAFAAAQAFARGIRAEMAEPLGGQGVGQALADVPALAQAFVVGGVEATRLDPRQRLQPWADASQVGDGRILGRIELLRQVAHAPLAPDAAAGRLQVSGEQAREQRLADAVASHQPGVPGVEGFVEIGKQKAAVRQLERDAIERQGRRIRHGYPLDAMHSPGPSGQGRKTGRADTAASSAHRTNTS